MHGLFISNPLNLKFVHHKDYNIYNNSVENLQWVTNTYNIKDSYQNINGNLNYRAVEQLDKEGNTLNIFKSITHASRKLNIPYESIINCCNGRQKTAKGFIFWYADWFEKEELYQNIFK